MNRKLLFILCATFCFALSACGSEDASQPTANSDSSTAQEGGSGTDQAVDYLEDTYQITYKGVTLYVNENMADVLDALGEPDSYFESESCAFQGMAKVYNYGSVVINTYPENDADYILTIELKDDIVETEEGIVIGSTRDEVVAAYGEADQENSTSLSYVKGHCTLAFIMENEVVSAITYTSDKASK